VQPAQNVLRKKDVNVQIWGQVEKEERKRPIILIAVQTIQKKEVKY